jgi:predicted transcriptional regulator
MDDDTHPVDQIAFLTRSRTRVRVLRHLAETGVSTQRDLREQIASSRSTLSRAVRSLEDHGWIRKQNGSYCLTPVGERVVEDLSELIETMQTTEKLSPFLTWFPLSEYDVDLSQLQDATVVSHSRGDPYAPGRAQTELLRRTRRFRALLPSIDLEGAKAAHEQIESQDLDAELVVSADVEQTISTDAYAPLLREQIRTGHLTVLVSEREPPFYLGLTDDGTVQLGVEDDNGFPQALLESSHESLREWAETVYQEYRATATVKSADDL